MSANILFKITCEISLLFIFAAVEEVDATSSYYEKMSEELEKIVNEVKNSPTEENKTFIDSIQPTDTETLSSECCLVHIVLWIK